MPVSNMDCSSFTVRHDFTTYISSLMAAGRVNQTLIEDCKAEICSALWGRGNPDVSGIGMIVGYAFDHATGLILAILVVCVASWETRWLSELGHSLLDRYHDCASFLCFSIQIAALVVLTKEESGISAANMGDGTVKITESVSVLTLLPLVYAVVLLPGSTGDQHDQSKSGKLARSEGQMEHGKRFVLLVLCWLAGFFPFYCRMSDVFGPSKISDSPTSAITPAQFAVIEGICFQGVNPISAAEDRLMTAMSIMAYVLVSLLVLGRILMEGLAKHHAQTKVYMVLAGRAERIGKGGTRLLVTGVLCCVPLLGCGLLWAVMRVQQFQTQLANSLNTGDADDKWTFGQVVAVTLFAPVLMEGWFLLAPRITAAVRGAGSPFDQQ